MNIAAVPTAAEKLFQNPVLVVQPPRLCLSAAVLHARGRACHSFETAARRVAMPALMIRAPSAPTGTWRRRSAGWRGVPPGRGG
jgi:hypothetical protein